VGVVMLIGAKSNCNHCLIYFFKNQLYKKKLENKLNIFHVTKFDILFYKCLKFEIISLTFRHLKVV
jgi:hypothetical protein